MKQIIHLSILFIIGFSIGMSGCSLRIASPPEPVYTPPPPEPGPPPWAPAHGYRAKYRYYYYPESRIYFDIGRGLYFYFYGGGWHASVSLPAGIYIDAREYIVLEMDVDKPYVFHSDVEKRYPPGYFKRRGKGSHKERD